MQTAKPPDAIPKPLALLELLPASPNPAAVCVSLYIT